MSRLAGLAPLLAFLGLRSVLAWRTEGDLPRESSFATYVGKFCFDYAPKPPAGIFNVTVFRQSIDSNDDEDPKNDELYLAVFDDEKQHWDRARPEWDALSCQERFELASFVKRMDWREGRFKFKVTINEKIRPRWWFFSFVACNRHSKEQLSYAIHAVNPNQGYEREFSMDEQGSILLHSIEIAAFAALLVVLLLNACLRFGTGFLRMRPLLSVLLLVLSLSALSGGCLLLHTRAFAEDGWGIFAALVLGDLLAALSRLLLSLLQLFVARGRDFLEAPGQFASRGFILAFIALYIVIVAWCEIFGRYFEDRDWHTSVYFYDSWAGATLLIMNCLLFIEVVRSTAMLLQDTRLSRKARTFFIRTSTVASLYFLVLPVMVLLAELFNPWVRSKFVQRAEVASRFVVCALLCFCLWPTQLDVVINAQLQKADTRDHAMEMAENIRVSDRPPPAS